MHDKTKNFIESIRKRTPLEIRFKVFLASYDHENWSNGEYHGKMDKDLLEPLLKKVEEWLNDGAPIRNERK